MAEGISVSSIPTAEDALRNLARNASKVLPDFTKTDPAIGVKELHLILDPVLETTDLPELSPGHRAAASNAVCAVIECCQASSSGYARESILDDSIWFRMFNVYLQRSDNAKGKSMRQILLVLTSVITTNESPRAFELRRQAATTLLDIICGRQDRIKVKPALQGLAHFLLRDVLSIAELIEIHEHLLKRTVSTYRGSVTSQTLFRAFLAWVVHHDTSLSAGHLIKNFLIQARKASGYRSRARYGDVSPLWIEPVVSMLHEWPDRMQEFKTHVFPHCFSPNIDEYMGFLSYLRFTSHIQCNGAIPGALRTFEDRDNGLDNTEELRILLAAVESGMELAIIRNNDATEHKFVTVRGGAIYLPDTTLGSWMSHPDPEVRLAGMFLSIYTTAITRPMTNAVFSSLKQNLVHLHTDTDVNFRSEVQGYTQKLFDRLRASSATLAKSLAKGGGEKLGRLPIPQVCFSQGTFSTDSQISLLLTHLAFVIWYIRFLNWELRCTASYQRRITALQSLTIVLRSGIDPGVPRSYLSKSAQGQLIWAHGVQIATPKLNRVLMDLIVDPFDDIRNYAVSVLQLCLLAQPVVEQTAMSATTRQCLQRAECMQLQTGRADQADGVARGYLLLSSSPDEGREVSNITTLMSGYIVFSNLTDQLKSTLAYASQDLSAAVNGRPVHGIFAALRYIVDQDGFYRSLSTAPQESFKRWKEAHDESLQSVEIFWQCVHHILCADAPEGLIPDDIEEEASLDTKEILSYSWRGLKEASTLLRAMISTAPIGDDASALISPALFTKLGRLCFTQLLELRHRGAFSTVSQTFAAFCRRCVSSNIATLRALPEVWYEETLRSIQDKAGAITRRSAGIPALMASIMAADPGNLFARAMNDLILEASVEAKSTNIEESRLPQVHALNCIKEFFTTSRLNVVSEAYMGQGLELAASTLNSNIWPIRNCSLMLFKALIERLLGSSEAQDWKEQDRARTSRFSYDDYPSLVNILSALLDPEGPLKQSIEATSMSNSPFDLHGAEGVFPALQILRQARPPAVYLERIMTSVEKLLASPHWHLRDMAARTIVSLRPTHQLYEATITLLRAGHGLHNLQHGSLLATKYMIRKLLQTTDDLSRFRDEYVSAQNVSNLCISGLENFAQLMGELGGFSELWYVPSHCPFVRAAFLDIVSVCGMAMLQRPKSLPTILAWQNLTMAVSIGPRYALGVSKRAGDALLRQSLAQVFFIDCVILRDDDLIISKEYHNIGAALMLLATEDQDTCCAALEMFGKVLTLQSSNDLTIPLELVLTHVHEVLLHATDQEVVSKAQAILADSLTSSLHKPKFFHVVMEEQTIDTLIKLEAQCLGGPPSNMRSALHLLGFFLDFAYTSYPTQRCRVLGAIARYVRLLRMTIVDTNPFDTRFAAVQSVCALDHFWTASIRSKATGPLLLALAIVLYDLLNDDDDEIRFAAALATTNLLRAQGNPKLKVAVPLLTLHHLAKFLASAFINSTDLLKESFRRLTATSSLSSTSLFGSFDQRLATARKEDTALFAREKQNLYFDPSLDAVYWSRILLRIPLKDTSASYCSSLANNYVLEGLSHLTNVADRENDGALGWTSKPEVFALGMRVFCAAEVVLKLGGARQRTEVMKSLSMFRDVGKKRDVHGLWLEKVDRILEKEIMRMIRGVRASLPLL